MRYVNEKSSTQRLRLKQCFRCDSFYQGTKFSKICKKCKTIKNT